MPPPFITVSGTVIDPNGIPYGGGTIVPVLNVLGSPLLPDGSPYVPPIGPFGLNKTGAFSFQLVANDQISPSGSTWSFIIASAQGTVPIAFGKSSVSFQVKNLVLLSSQDITTQISAVVQPLTFSTSGGGGAGTVMSVAAGNLNPLFTTVVASPSTTPTIAFTLEDAPPNTMLGNNTSVSAPPTFIPIPLTVVAKGQTALGTGAIAPLTTRAVMLTSGLQTTDIIAWSLNGNVAGSAGYQAGQIIIYVNILGTGVAQASLTNPSSSSVTPGPINLNWMVLR